jgi:hypothetical protein
MYFSVIALTQRSYLRSLQQLQCVGWEMSTLHDAGKRNPVHPLWRMFLSTSQNMCQIIMCALHHVVMWATSPKRIPIEFQLLQEYAPLYSGLFRQRRWQLVRDK